jgi:uncharacterized protein (TIGR02453 family)
VKPTIQLDLALRFLSELSQNNTKAWFDQNRAVYAHARGAFGRLIDLLIDELRASDVLQDLSAKDCVLRIYRDMRFSKDKSPYKTNLGAMIAPGGRKSTRMGYYVAVEPRGYSMIAGGLYAPSSAQLIQFRRGISQDAQEFKDIIGTRTFVDCFGPVKGERLKTAPQGYDQAHPEIGLLRLKQVTVQRHFSDEEVLAPDFPERLVVLCREMKPFLAYLDRILSGI